MKKLLQECLGELLHANGWRHSDGKLVTPSSWESGQVWRLNTELIERVQNAIAALSPEASHAEAILAHADGLEDEGNWRAHTLRLLFADPVDTAALLASIQVAPGTGYCTVTRRPPGNYVIDGITLTDPGDTCVQWTIPIAECPEN